MEVRGWTSKTSNRGVPLAPAMYAPLKNFRTNSAIRVVALGATVLAGFAVYFVSGSLLASGLIGAVALYQLYALIRYVEKTNRDLARLLESIRYSDFTQGFTAAERGGSYLELSGALRGVIDDFKAARRAKEESFRYLQTVMQHVGVGLISFKRDGEVNLINSAAKKLLRIPYLRRLDRLEEISPSLVQALQGLRSGEKTLVRVTRSGEELDLSIYATEFKLGGDFFKLVSIQNIRSELEETEVEAWQKLTRVLAHEIMNSVAPIASLASTANGLLSQVRESTDEAPDELADIRGAISTIARRSEGLLGFVESYRQVTRVPEPVKERFQVADLFSQVDRLLRPRLKEAGVNLSLELDPKTIEINADREQIEQVLINLVKNASEAFAETENGDRMAGYGEPATPSVALRARFDDRGHPLIEVVDNGPGIPEDVRERMFIPFYTTKKGGTGIGLSLSREILRRHGGSLYLDDDGGTRFVLRF